MNELLEPTLVSNLSLLVNTSLVDVVAQKIRSNIYTGKYEAGKKLIVRELSEEFGVSHTPVKDALNRLIAEGYVEALPRRSVVVRAYSNSELIDAMQARMMCEIFCADQIVQAVGEHPEILAEMRDVQQKMRQIVASRDVFANEDWVSYETRFHQSYMSHCGNERLYKFYQDLGTNRITFLAYLGTNHSPLKMSTLESNVLEHQGILDALEEGDSRRFINASVRHISRACEDYAVDDECRSKLEKLKKVKAKYET